MAQLIELTTPEQWVKKGKQFKDWSLDAQSLRDNCQRIAEDLARENRLFTERNGQRRPIMPNDVMQATQQVVMELGKIVRGHRAYMDGLGGARP